MQDDRFLRRKWVLKAHNQQVVFVKSPRESSEHVLMKIFLWALYLPTYPKMSVEMRIGDRYKPDVVALNDGGVPIFWGEAGVVGREKMEKLLKHYRDTHFAMAKWATNLDPYEAMVREAMQATRRNAPFDLIRIPHESVERFIRADGQVVIAHRDIEWRRID